MCSAKIWMVKMPMSFSNTLGGSELDIPLLEFLKRLIQKSCPYSPRGGFSRNSPNDLVKAFTVWLQNQQEPLSYDLVEPWKKRTYSCDRRHRRNTSYSLPCTFLVYRPSTGACLFVGSCFANRSSNLHGPPFQSASRI